MHLERLSTWQSEVIGEALRAAADGPFFPEWEFSTLFGLSRSQVRRIADQWPFPSEPPDDIAIAVNNSLNMLTGYPHRKYDLWDDWLSVAPQQLRDLLRQLRG